MTAVISGLPNLARSTGQAAPKLELQYRRARPEDLPAMAVVFLSALGDLQTRNNVVAPLPLPSAVIAGYEHVLSTGIFHVVEMEREIVAIAGAIVRDQNWFLSGFWMRPDLQRRGIGMPLLRRVWQEGHDAGAIVFYTWASSDPTAMAAYMKLDMLPGSQIMHFEGVPRPATRPAAAYEVAALEPAVAMALDLIILGTLRPQDHDFWRTQSNVIGRQLLHHGRVAGYYYLQDGKIGPVGWADWGHAETLLSTAFAEAAATAPQVRLSIPGPNRAALRYAFESGLRFTGFSHFLTTRPFERLAWYLPSGPTLF